MRINEPDPTPELPREIEVLAGPHAEIRALEKARQEYGPSVEIGEVLFIGHLSYIYEVKEIRK